MATPSVDHSAAGYRLVGTRVSLDSIAYAFWNGQTAESISLRPASRIGCSTRSSPPPAAGPPEWGRP